MIEATHGFAQSSHGLHSPDSDAAERVAWSVPAERSAPPSVAPTPSATASTATNASFMIRPINIACTRSLIFLFMFDLRPSEARDFSIKVPALAYRLGHSKTAAELMGAHGSFRHCGTGCVNGAAAMAIVTHWDLQRQAFARLVLSRATL